MHRALKTTKYKPDVKYVILGAAAKVLLIVKYVCFPWFFMYYNMNQGLSLLLHYCHSNISFVAYKVLFINSVIFKFSNLKQYKYVINYLNRLPKMLAFILISIYYNFVLVKINTRK
jgi:hypothetical protein